MVQLKQQQAAVLLLHNTKMNVMCPSVGACPLIMHKYALGKRVIHWDTLCASVMVQPVVCCCALWLKLILTLLQMSVLDQMDQTLGRWWGLLLQGLQTLKGEIF